MNSAILLIDELIGAGDIRFAEKAKRRMFEFIEQGKVLVFASDFLVYDIRLFAQWAISFRRRYRQLNLVCLGQSTSNSRMLNNER
jgi:hypothetical protein